MREKSLSNQNYTSLCDTIMIFKPDEEANICLKCKAEKCNGNCKRFAEKKKKLKGRKQK